jgi:hypothetical protein
MKIEKVRMQQTGDKFAICLSAVCLIHCLAIPLILLVFPSLALASMSDELFHLIMLIGVLPISVLTLGSGFLTHRDKSVLVAGAAGLSFLSATLLTHHHIFGHWGETLFTVIGSIVVASAHFRNARLRKLQFNSKPQI